MLLEFPDLLLLKEKY